MEPKLRIDPAELGEIPLLGRSRATEEGISDKDLKILVRRGFLLHIDHGWYSTLVTANAEERHVLRTVAALRLQGPGVAASAHSAALLHGLPLARCDLDLVDLTRKVGHGRHRRGVRITERPELQAVPVRAPLVDELVDAVAVPECIVGIALRNNPAAALVAGDHAVRHGMCTRAQVESSLAQHRGSRGIEAAQQALAHLEPRHESPGETLTAHELRKLGWDLEPQYEVVANGCCYRLDFRVKGTKIGVEFDGESKYLAPDGFDCPEHRAGVMAAQEKRVADLRDEGWALARFRWADLDEPGEMQRRMRAAEAEAARLEALRAA